MYCITADLFFRRVLTTLLPRPARLEIAKTSRALESPNRPERRGQVNPHNRPAAKLVDCAARYTSEIRLTHQGQTIDAKSIMSVLMLAAPCGAILEVTLDGNDEQAALEALEVLFNSGFGELE